MPVSTAEAFEKRQVAREDGVQVLPRSVIPVAALEAGYHLSSPAINDAVANSKYPGQMTNEEFAAFCDNNKDSFVSAEKLAKAVVVVAPTNVITRASLEDIINRSSKPEDCLSEEEVEALFTTLDTDNRGAIDAEDFMRAIHGEEGAIALYQARLDAAKEAEARAAKAKEDARRAEEARKKREAEEKAKKDAAAAEEKEKNDKAEEKKKKTSACC